MAEAAHGRVAANVRPASPRRYGIVPCLVTSAVLSVLVEWAGMVFWWPEEGSAHAARVLATEVGYLHGDFSAAASKVGGYAGRGFYWAFEWTGIRAGVEWLGTQVGLLAYAEAALLTLQVFMVRVVLLGFSLPAFLLFGAVGVTSGLTLRDIRRWSAGREFGGVYHRSKRIAPTVLKAAAVVYLAIPFAVHPTAVIVPGAALFGVMVMLVTSTFKKYL